MDAEDVLSFDDSKAGTHICSIYKYSSEQALATVTFFTPALCAGTKCIYASNQTNRNQLTEVFDKKGLDTKKYIKSGQLLLFDNKSVYLTGDSIDVEKMLGSIKNAEEQAVKEGYKDVRFSGELPFISGGTIDENNIVTYEQVTDKHLQFSGSTAICHYDETKYNPNALTKIISSHPYIMIYGNFYKNKFFNNYSGESYKEIIEAIIVK